MVLAATRLVFQQPDKERATFELRALADRLQGRLPRAAALLAEAEEEILAHMDFPREHWTKLSSTNPLERLNKEIARRTRVVGIFPTRGSLIRLSGALLAEQSDEWAVSRRYMSQGSLAALYAEEDDEAGRIITHPVLVPVH